MCPIFQYRCECGKEFERISSYPEKTRYCSCGKFASIQVSAHAKTDSKWKV